MATETLADRGFSQRIGFGHRPALLVIDVIQGFTDPKSPLGAEADVEVAQINRLITASRSAAVPVFFSTIQYEEDDAADAGLWIKKIHALRDLTVETGRTLLDARPDRDPREAIIAKKFASCFFGTDLVSRLTSRRIDTVILAGGTTSGCVRATAVDACQYGFRPIVAREAVFDRLSDAHEQSLADIDLKYGDVLSVDTIVSILASADAA